MAVTKTLRIAENKKGHPAAHLKNNLFYICNPEKTEDGKWMVSNAGSTADEIYSRYLRNKKSWEKKYGTQAFHYMLSLPPGSGTPDTLMKVAQEFVKELLGDRFYYTIAVHTDKPHLHAHITFDSVSALDGKKFHSPKGDWRYRLQPITDRLCRKYQLPTLEYNPDDKKGMYHSDWEKQKNPKKNAGGDNSSKYDWNDVIRDDIDEAVYFSSSYVEFISYLKEHGYVIRDGKYLSVRPFGKENAVRTFRLGGGYTKNDIINRISGQEMETDYVPFHKTYGDIAYIKKIMYAKISCTKNYSLTPFQKAYYKKWHNTFFIRRPYFRDSWKYKKDILRVHKLAEQLYYIIDHDIKTYDDIVKQRDSVSSRLDKVTSLKKAELTKCRSKRVLKAAAQYEKKTEKSDLLELQSVIEQEMDLQEALYLLHQTQDRIGYYKKEMKQLKKELDILDRIENGDLSTPEIDEDWMEDQYERKKFEKGCEKGPGKVTRVTIHAKLFYGEFNKEKEFLESRIPYTKVHVQIPMEHCMLHRNGKICSAYIHDDFEYNVFSDGLKEKVKGSRLKKYYENKNRNKQIVTMEGWNEQRREAHRGTLGGQKRGRPQ